MTDSAKSLNFLFKKTIFKNLNDMGIQVIDLETTLRKVEDQDSLYPLGDAKNLGIHFGHFSPKGYEIIAEEITKRIPSRRPIPNMIENATILSGFRTKKYAVIITPSKMRPLIIFCPEYVIGCPLIFPCNFPQAIKLPENVNEPIMTDRTIVIIVIVRSLLFFSNCCK